MPRLAAGLQPRCGGPVVTRAARSRRWRGARRPAGTAGVWLGWCQGHASELTAQPEQLGDPWLGAVGSESHSCSKLAGLPAVFKF
jgi:hypothetical protein